MKVRSIKIENHITRVTHYYQLSNNIIFQDHKKHIKSTFFGFFRADMSLSTLAWTIYHMWKYVPWRNIIVNRGYLLRIKRKMYQNCSNYQDLLIILLIYRYWKYLIDFDEAVYDACGRSQLRNKIRFAFFINILSARICILGNRRYLEQIIYLPPEIGVAPAVAAAVVPVTPAAADCAAFCFNIVQSNV